MESAWDFFGNVVPRMLITDGTIQGVQKLLGDELGLHFGYGFPECQIQKGQFWCHPLLPLFFFSSLV